MKERTHQQRILPRQYSAPFKKIGCGHRCKEIIQIVKNRTHTLSPFLALIQNLNVLCCLPSDNIMYNVFSLMHSYNISTSRQLTTNTYTQHIPPYQHMYMYTTLSRVYPSYSSHKCITCIHHLHIHTHMHLLHLCTNTKSPMFMSK